MKNSRSLALLVALLFCFAVIGMQAADDKGPAEIVFETKQGNVTYPHAKHVEAVKGDCKVCHDTLFPQERAELNYKKAMHKTSEKDMTSCGSCHRPEGAAFESKGNCAKCHEKKK